MPLKKKLSSIGNSRAVVIPPGWIRYYEEKAGQPVNNVLMELDNVITICIPGGNENQSEVAVCRKKV